MDIDEEPLTKGDFYEALEKLVNKENIKDMATKQDLEGFATKQDLVGLAKKDDVIKVGNKVDELSKKSEERHLVLRSDLGKMREKHDKLVERLQDAVKV